MFKTFTDRSSNSSWTADPLILFLAFASRTHIPHPGKGTKVHQKPCSYLKQTLRRMGMTREAVVFFLALVTVRLNS
jgi:hypothetical protein